MVSRSAAGTKSNAAGPMRVVVGLKRFEEVRNADVKPPQSANQPVGGLWMIRLKEVLDSRTLSDVE